MMLFYNNNNSVGQIQDEEFVQLGKKHGIPTLNDAAADVPPVENLWKYTKMGFDLVAFSGGKGIRGPQSAGLLLGRKDLIAAARLNGSPNGNTIGRGMKVNKEEMLGMLAAVELYRAEGSRGASGASSTRAPRRSATSAADVPGVKAEIFVPEVANHVPHVRDLLGRGGEGDDGGGVVKALRDGEPSIGTRSEGDATRRRRLDDAAGRREDRRTAASRGAVRTSHVAMIRAALFISLALALASGSSSLRRAASRRRTTIVVSPRSEPHVDGVRVRHRGLWPRCQGAARDPR